MPKKNIIKKLNTDNEKKPINAAAAIEKKNFLAFNLIYFI